MVEADARPRALRRAFRVAVGAVVLSPFVIGTAAADEGPPKVEEFLVRDHLIAESSGLTAQDVEGERLFTTVNDSGDFGRVFTLDPRSGVTVGTTRWTPDPMDVEALAPDGDHVWVGDIGDNSAKRPYVTVTRVPIGRGDRVLTEAEAESYDLAYPDHGRDAETLLRHPTTGRLYVVSKSPLGGEVWEAPETLDPDRPNVLTSIGIAPPIVTDGSFTPSGDRLVLRTYTHTYALSWPELAELHRFELPRQPQGEGLAVSPEGDVFVSTEGRERPVLRVDVPFAARVDVGQRVTLKQWWKRFWDAFAGLAGGATG